MASVINASTTLGLVNSADTSGVLQLQTANTTAVTINASQNVGIGTASPSTKLDVNGNLNVSSAGNIFTASTSGVFFNGNGSYATGIYNNGSGNLLFAANGSLRATIDPSGNLGLGVTPSAWASPVGTAIELPNGTTFAAYTSGGLPSAYLTSNGYYNGSNWVYKVSKPAVQYQLNGNSGIHQWFISASGTAGNAISFTQALTLTSGGDLCVGATSSTSSRLLVKGANTASSEFALRLHDSADTVLFYVRNDGYTQTGGGANSPYNLTTASAANLWVGSNGELRRSTSSLKYKTDVQDAVHGLAEVMALRSVTYKGKNDGDTIFGGLIAEEVHASGLTEFVQYAEDGTPDALSYGQMVSLAFKAIQEQQALITQLQADIATLKGN